MSHWEKLFWVGELVSGDWLVVSKSRSLIDGSRLLVMGEFLLGWPC